MKMTYKLNIAFLLLIAAAVLLPQYTVDPAGGLAAAGTAAVTFFSVFLLAMCLASYQFYYTLRWRKNLSKLEQVFGMIPIAISLLIIAFFFLFLKYQ